MKIILKFSLIYLLSVQTLMAWGSTGHRIVGKVAETYLTGNAKMQSATNQKRKHENT